MACTEMSRATRIIRTNSIATAFCQKATPHFNHAFGSNTSIFD
eukprot:XP_001707728.1 Hypothetical protein GL50803_6837 [Giardia lamblia ATCC 50803]